MEKLPSELFQRIFFYIDELGDLHRASVVCRHWRSLLMGNEHFLNKWFHRSLKSSQQAATSTRGRQTRRTADRSLFPVQLQSSECYLLRLLDPFSRLGSQDYFQQTYPRSLFEGFHSFSFWFFFSRECELVIRIGYTDVLDLHSCSHADFTSDEFGDKQVLLADQWIHVALANINSLSRYRIWINGQDLRKFHLHRTFNSHLLNSDCSHSIALSYKLRSYSMQSPLHARLANLAAFKRCLSTMEIRAIYQQQASIDRVQIGTYVTNKQAAHRKIKKNRRWLGFLSAFLALLDLIRSFIVGYLSDQTSEE